MAEAVRTKAQEVFEKKVAWEVREFADCGGQPDFAVTGWVTDNEDKLADVVLTAQAEILTVMQYSAYKDQTVECWWQRVKGKWSGAKGLIPG